MMFKLGSEGLDSERGLPKKREHETREEMRPGLRAHPAQSPQWERACHGKEPKGGRKCLSARTQRGKQQKRTLVKFKSTRKLLEGD